MRHCLLIIVFAIFAAGSALADSTSKPGTQPMTDRISTADFDVSLPHGWRVLRSESKPGMVVFQSADGNARLTVSVARDSAPPGAKDGDTDLANISEVRRQTEMKLAPKVRLTPRQSTSDNGVWSSTWRGDDSASGRQTATLVRLAKSKRCKKILKRV
jgi:hypothetical protein